MRQWETNGKALMLSPPSMHTGHSSAGVGFQHDNTTLVTKLDIKHGAFQRAHDNGRIKHCLVIVDKNISFPVYTIYGYTGGHHNSIAALNTSQLFEIAVEENRLQGKPPAVICTDLNADPEDINFLRDQLLAADRWLDIGARASVWGGCDNQPTCHPTNNTLEGTRRDYIFMHPALARYIKEVKVVDDGTFATHARIEMIFQFDGSKIITRTSGKK